LTFGLCVGYWAVEKVVRTNGNYGGGGRAFWMRSHWYCQIKVRSCFIVVHVV